MEKDASITFGQHNTISGIQIGHNSGTVHATIHLPQERPETPPEPFSTVPFPRDIDYVDRTELHELDEKLSNGGTKIALCGLGGIGYVSCQL